MIVLNISVFGTSQASKMELFTKIVNSWKLLNNIAKSQILDVLYSSEYSSAKYAQN